MASTKSAKHILWFKEIGIEDVPVVGGKNASLGEMYVCMRVILLLSSTPRSLAHTIPPPPFFSFASSPLLNLIVTTGFRR